MTNVGNNDSINLVDVDLTKQNTFRPSQIDLVIGKCVEDIWDKYDDGNGFLDKRKTKRFVQDTLADMSDGVGFNDADFNQLFDEFSNGSGTIERG